MQLVPSKDRCKQRFVLSHKPASSYNYSTQWTIKQLTESLAEVNGAEHVERHVQRSIRRKRNYKVMKEVIADVSGGPRDSGEVRQDEVTHDNITILRYSECDCNCC